MDRPTEEPQEFRFDRETIEAPFLEGWRDAKLRHKRAGVPMVGWEDGRIKIMPPEEIDVSDCEDAAGGAGATTP